MCKKKILHHENGSSRSFLVGLSLRLLKQFPASLLGLSPSSLIPPAFFMLTIWETIVAMSKKYESLLFHANNKGAEIHPG